MIDIPVAPRVPAQPECCPPRNSPPADFHTLAISTSLPDSADFGEEVRPDDAKSLVHSLAKFHKKNDAAHAVIVDRTVANRFLYGLEDNLVLPNLRVGIALINPDQRLLTCDEDFALLVGQTRESLFGRPLSELHSVFASEEEGEVEVAERLLAFKWLRPDKSDLPSTLTLVEKDSLRAPDLRLRQSLEAFEQLVDASPVGIVVLDAKKKVVLWNKAAEVIFGWNAAEIVGKPYPLVPKAEWSKFSQLFDRVMRGQGYRDIESTRRRKDDSEVALSMSTTPIRDSSGTVIAALALLDDLTQQKLLEAKLSERVRLEAIGQLASGVAHNFNNMLTVISAHCGFLMKRGDLEGQDKESLVAIERCVVQASDLTSQLLTFGRKQIIRPTNLDLHVATLETVGMLTKLLGPNIKVELELMSSHSTCRIDSTQFSQLLVNLLTNARDAIGDRGTIRASSEMGELDGQRAIVLSIADTGVGIPADQIARVFEPFFTSKNIGEGTGLGLSTAFGIAEQAGGRLRVKSEEGLGTTFTLLLPLADGTAPTQSEPQEAGPLAVLLVDDDDLVRETLTELMRLEGHRVHPANSGSAGLEALEAENFDVVVTDVYMPDMDGAEFIRQAETRHGKLRVLFMSGNLADSELRDSVEHGLASIIKKPIYPEELERALVEVISGRVYK